MPPIGSGRVGGTRFAVSTLGTWTTEVLLNSLVFPASNQNGYWGALQWSEDGGDDDSSVTIDILRASDDAVLVSGLTHQLSGHDLSVLSAVRSEDIKIRFNLTAKAKSPVVDNIELAVVLSTI